MKSLGSSGSFLWTLLLVLVALICTGKSYKPELWFYDAQDDAIQFHSKVASTADFSLFLPKVTRACARGHWHVFSAANFQTDVTNFGSESSSGIECSNFTEAASVKSLRHMGANDTDTDALSLYEGPGVSGKEVYVTALAHTGITHKIEGIAITGTSDWKLFEGQELDGKSLCYKVPSGYYTFHNFVSSLNLTTVGSVYRNCNVQEIENYKRLHMSSFVNAN